MLAVVALFALMLVTILVLRFIDPPTWAWKIHRDVNPPIGYPAELRHQWLDIQQIPLSLQLAVVASEDQNFPHHHGVDFSAIKNAINEAEQGRSLRGASTITQQTVKFTLAELEIFFPVVESAINAAGVVDFPVPAHGLKGFRQCPPIVVGITGRIGHFVEIVVKTGIATSDIGQDIIEKLLPVRCLDLFPGKRLRVLL
jgi:hypothetical protein